MTSMEAPRLMSCPVCEHSVSSHAPTCPSCGHPLKPQQTKALQHSRASRFTRFGAFCTGLALPCFVLTLLMSSAPSYYGLIWSAAGIALGFSSLIVGAVLGVSRLAADRIGDEERRKSNPTGQPLSL